MWGRGRRTFEQRRRWELVRVELRRGQRVIATAGFVMLGGAAVLALLPVGHPLLRGVVSGSLMASWFWMVFTLMLLRTYPATIGEWGESFTRELLHGRRFGWPVVDDVALEYRNIDHIAVSPLAVLAIETKFVGAGRQWDTDPFRESAMRGARSSARSVRSLLRAQGIMNVPVQPVLMLWGPAAPDLADGWAVVEDVHVVRGTAAAEEWRQHCGSGDITSDQAMLVESKLLEYRAMRDAHRHGRAGLARTGKIRHQRQRGR